MKNPLKNIYLKSRLFIALSVVIVLFVVSFWANEFFTIALLSFMLVVALAVVEALVLFQRKGLLHVKRTLAEQLSLGDENKVHLHLTSNYQTRVYIEVIDELPYQLQKRDLSYQVILKGKASKEFVYTIQPKTRGVYTFNSINAYVTTSIGFVQRRFEFDKEMETGVYPSILQMRKHEFQVFNKSAASQGVKKIRKLGNTNEFEQIKEYVVGDDIKHINWKATSRRAELMVNQYQDEKSQQIYCIIDKSRSMRMPFNDLSLLDYAINSTLVMSNIALKKGDKAGLITFSDKIGTELTANRNAVQLRRIMEVLYKQKTDFLEPNFELLYQSIRKTVKGRSLLLLFTNFESMYSLERALPVLRKLHKNYLLVTIMFENTEISDAAEMECKDVSDIYLKTFAKKFVDEKKFMISELRTHGIQSILTKPENLSVNAINKYLELKSRGMI